MISLLEAGAINFEGWVSHRIPFDNIQEAFEIANDPNIDKMKIIVYL